MQYQSDQLIIKRGLRSWWNYRKSSIFAADEINTGRQSELDIARGLAIVFMIFCHVIEYHASWTFAGSALSEVIYLFAGVPAAPVFMFTMGVGFGYSRRSGSPGYFLKRGLVVLLAAYILNFLRGSAPVLAGTFLQGKTEATVALRYALEIDILHFAGLALIFWSVLLTLRLNTKPLSLFAVLILIWVAQYSIMHYEVGSFTVKALTGLLWGSSKMSYFPFLSWISYPLFGYLFALALRRCINNNRFYLFFGSGAFLLVIGIVSLYTHFGIEYGMTTDYDYYHHWFSANLLYGIFIIGWLGLLYFAAKILPATIKRALERWSGNINLMYLIHWILIGWAGLVVPETGLEVREFLVMGIVIFVLSDLIASLLRRKGVKAL